MLFTRYEFEFEPSIVDTLLMTQVFLQEIQLQSLLHTKVKILFVIIIWHQTRNVINIH